MRQLLQKLTGKADKQEPQPTTQCDKCEYEKCSLHPDYTKEPGTREYRYYIGGKCPELQHKCLTTILTTLTKGNVTFVYKLMRVFVRYSERMEVI